MSNGFYAHIRRNRGHTVEWRDAVFIDKEKHWKGRKIKEALYINAQNPKKTVDKSRILNLEKGLDLDPIWETLMISSEGLYPREFRGLFDISIICFNFYAYHMFCFVL